MIQPSFDNVLIRIDKVEAVTASGLFVPGITQKASQFATVVAAGEDAKFVKQDDKVVLGDWTGVAVMIDDEELIIIKEEHVLGIVK